jgi:hypothetical protein
MGPIINDSIISTGAEYSAPCTGYVSSCIKAFHPTQIHIGQWLLDARLLNIPLDVRIRGTTALQFHQGRYENHCGRLMLNAVPANNEASVKMKIGLVKTNVYMRPRYLFPEITTETTQMPGYVSASPIQRIVHVFGERVVIIGPDIYGTSDYVGSYGFISYSGYQLPVDQACVRFSSPGQYVGQGSYFMETSLCRSRVDY